MSRLTVKASELKRGDLIYLGGNSCVLVADTTTRNGKVEVTIFNGDTPKDKPTYRHEPNEDIRLNGRGLR